MDHDTILRSIGYFIEFLAKISPIVILGFLAYKVCKS